MREPSIRVSNDRALSEVIGFVLIIALIVVIASLYLTYGVPAQGREAEILHMNEIKDEFVAYKLSLDSLFTNEKIGMSVSNSFTPGSGGDYTQGMLGFIPLMNPIPSSGILAINAADRDEVLTITSRSLVTGSSSSRDVTELPAGTPRSVQNTPENLYVNVTIPTGALTSATYYGTEMSGTGWRAVVNVTPRIVTTPAITGVFGLLSTCPAGTYQSGQNATYILCMNPVGGTLYNGTDIRVSITKANSTTLQDIPVFTGISSGRSYSVDLMDPAYGLASSMTYPDTITLQNTLAKSSGTITGTGNASYGYKERDYSMAPLRLGSLEFRMQNNYWIPQTYYYQMGGVFLAQNDGNITWKLPPEITATNDTVSSSVTVVNVNALALDNRSQGMIGGNSPIQIRTSLSQITEQPLASVSPGRGNTKWVRIAINTTNNQSRNMWYNYFDFMSRTNGIPNATPGFLGNEAFLFINGSDSGLSRYDINMIASNATYLPTIQGVGGIVQ